MNSFDCVMNTSLTGFKSAKKFWVNYLIQNKGNTVKNELSRALKYPQQYPDLTGDCVYALSNLTKRPHDDMFVTSTPLYLPGSGSICNSRAEANSYVRRYFKQLTQNQILNGNYQTLADYASSQMEKKNKATRARRTAKSQPTSKPRPTASVQTTPNNRQKFGSKNHIFFHGHEADLPTVKLPSGRFLIRPVGYLFLSILIPQLVAYILGFELFGKMTFVLLTIMNGLFLLDMSDYPHKTDFITKAFIVIEIILIYSYSPILAIINVILFFPRTIKKLINKKF